MTTPDDESIGILPELLAKAAAAAVPAALVDAIQHAARTQAPDPVEGHLWRACWDDLNLLVVILGAGDGQVLVAPVTLDPATGDDKTLVLSPELSVLGVPIAVWVGLARDIPVRVLDSWLGELDASVTGALIGLRRGDSNARLPHGTSLGDPITSPFDPLAGVLAGVSDTLDDLAAATWLQGDEAGSGSLQEILGPKPDLAALQQALAIPLPAVWAIVRGRAPLTPVYARVIAELTGVPEEDVLAVVPPPPEELVRELDHPRWRNALRRERRTRHLSDTDVHREVAYGTLAMAARQTGTTVPAWSERIRQYLASGQHD